MEPQPQWEATRPPNFYPALDPCDVDLSLTAPEFADRSQKHRGKRYAGLLYEEQTIQHLTRHYSDFLLPSPWFTFISEGLYDRWCQPDALLINWPKLTVVILEIKLKHTIKAWWQLRRLYEPVIRAYFPYWRVRVCEICKFYDKAEPFPEEPRLTAAPLSLDRHEFGVHIHNPSRGARS